MKQIIIPPIPISAGSHKPRYNWDRFFRVDRVISDMFWDGEPLRGDDNTPVVATLEADMLSIPEHAFARAVQYLARTHTSEDGKEFVADFLEGKSRVLFQGRVYEFHHDYEPFKFCGWRLMPERI